MEHLTAREERLWDTVRDLERRVKRLEDGLCSPIPVYPTHVEYATQGLSHQPPSPLDQISIKDSASAQAAVACFSSAIAQLEGARRGRAPSLNLVARLIRTGVQWLGMKLPEGTLKAAVVDSKRKLRSRLKPDSK